MSRAYIGLGSNLHHPEKNIISAIQSFRALPSTLNCRSSSFYLTEPQGFADQNDFINAVIELDTTLTPEELLDACLTIEKQHHRVRLMRNGPRILDCDILLYDDLILKTAGLTVPHPRLHERLFVLVPLLELVGEIEIPHHGHLSHCQEKITNQGIRLIEGQIIFA